MKKNKELYRVYSINTCFDKYGFEQVLIGARTKKDLIKYLRDYVDDKYMSEPGRIKPIYNLYTDKPYKVLNFTSYYE